jgi:hypothetical protein
VPRTAIRRRPREALHKIFALAFMAGSEVGAAQADGLRSVLSTGIPIHLQRSNQPRKTQIAARHGGAGGDVERASVGSRGGIVT